MKLNNVNIENKNKYNYLSLKKDWSQNYKVLLF